MSTTFRREAGFFPIQEKNVQNFPPGLSVSGVLAYGILPKAQAKTQKNIVLRKKSPLENRHPHDNANINADKIVCRKRNLSRFQRGEIPGKAFRHQKQNVTQTAGYDTIKSEDTIGRNRKPHRP